MYVVKKIMTFYATFYVSIFYFIIDIYLSFVIIDFSIFVNQFTIYENFFNIHQYTTLHVKALVILFLQGNELVHEKENQGYSS